MKYLVHLLKAKYRKGRGIHSPYLFSFISEAVFNSRGLVLPDAIIHGRRQLLTSKHTLRIQDLGAGSRGLSAGSRGLSATKKVLHEAASISYERTIASIARHSSVTAKSARLLHRISKWYAPSDIIELGTGLGISTACLALGCPDAKLITVEGSAEKAKFARGFLESLGVQDASVIAGRFEDVLPGLLDTDFKKLLVFIDGNHRYEATMHYMRLCLESKAEDMLIILDDIHWSEGMERAWKEIIAMKEISVSLDTFFHGILMFKKELQTQDLIVRF